jgi:GrpB-like predicted nucleotidyltransferase (UPF0157 family)
MTEEKKEEEIIIEDEELEVVGNFKERIEKAETESEKIIIFEDWLKSKLVEDERSKYNNIISEMRKKEFDDLRSEYIEYYHKRNTAELKYKDIQDKIKSGNFQEVEDFINGKE